MVLMGGLSMEGLADLHVHSVFSDGTMTPEELADAALEAGVSLLAVADHNILKGSEQIAPLLAARGIGYIPAVELDCVLPGDRFYHVLAYGADFADERFRTLVRNNRMKLDQMSVELIARMEKHDSRVSAADFERFERDPRWGGWKGLAYLLSRGVTTTIHQGMAFYGQYDVTYEAAGFPTLREMVDAIHAASGRAVLAHPGERIDQDDRQRFVDKLSELLDFGLDGVECHYPTNPQWLTDACLDVCAERGLIVTCGSDCHGAFGQTRVGDACVSVAALRLEGVWGLHPQTSGGAPTLHPARD